MSEKGTRTTINGETPLRVRDIMSSPVITVKGATPVDKVAQLMGKHSIGCVIVTGEGEMPLGIITERDLALRVVAKNLQPQKVSAREVMSSPLFTTDPDQPIATVARTMGRVNIRRLVVVEKGKLTGIITSKDITATIPALIEVIEERARLGRAITGGLEDEILTGCCESCGNWSEVLREVDGRYLCENCQVETEERTMSEGDS